MKKFCEFCGGKKAYQIDETLEMVEEVLGNEHDFGQDTRKWAKEWKQKYDKINDMSTGHGDFTELDYHFNDKDLEKMMERDKSRKHSSIKRTRLTQKAKPKAASIKRIRLTQRKK
jgi:hypothetical protein